jgi:hypothetical protein
MTLFGDRPLAAQFVSAAFGILTIPLTFALGLILFDRGTGLLSAALLAFLPYHVMYSRIAFPEADSTFLFYAAFLARALGMKTKRRKALVCLFAFAVFLGLAATTNYRIWPIVAQLLLTELVIHVWIHSASTRPGTAPTAARNLVIHTIVLAAGTIIAPLVWEAGFCSLRIYAAQQELAWNLRSYASQLRNLLFGEQLAQCFADLAKRIDLSFYVKSLWTLGTPVFTVLAFSGVALLYISLSRRQNLSRAVVGARLLLSTCGFVVPFLFFTAFPLSAARFLSIALPSGALLAGVALRQSAARWCIPAFAVLLVAIALELAGAWPMVRWQSGFQVAADYLRQQGVRRVISTQQSIAQYYAVSPAQARFGPISDSELWTDWEDGYRYLLVDEQGYVAGPDARLLERIERDLRPRFVTPDPYKRSLAYYLEQDPTYLSFDGRRALFRQLRSRETVPQVRVYELTEGFANTLHKPPPPTYGEVTLTRQLLKTPGFESFDGHEPVGWGPYGNPIFDVSGRRSHTGEAAVCSRGDGRSGYTQVVEIAPGATYLLSEWVHSGSEFDEWARLQVNWLDADGAIVGVGLEVVPALSDAWRQRSIRVVAPNNAAQAAVYVSVHMGAKVCFDDFFFAEISQQ